MKEANSNDGQTALPRHAEDYLAHIQPLGMSSGWEGVRAREFDWEGTSRLRVLGRRLLDFLFRSQERPERVLSRLPESNTFDNDEEFEDLDRED